MVIAAGVLMGVLWLARGGVRAGRGSGSYAVWILVPFIVIICGVGVWLLLGVIKSTSFGLIR